MSKTLILSVAVVLSGCNAPYENSKKLDGYVGKTCDQGRAVYFDRSGHGGVFVVENAPECQSTEKPNG